MKTSFKIYTVLCAAVACTISLTSCGSDSGSNAPSDDTNSSSSKTSSSSDGSNNSNSESRQKITYDSLGLSIDEKSKILTISREGTDEEYCVAVDDGFKWKTIKSKPLNQKIKYEFIGDTLVLYEWFSSYEKFDQYGLMLVGGKGGNIYGTWTATPCLYDSEEKESDCNEDEEDKIQSSFTISEKTFARAIPSIYINKTLNYPTSSFRYVLNYTISEGPGYIPTANKLYEEAFYDIDENTKFTVSQTGTGLKLNYFCDTDSIWSAHSDVLDMDAMTTLSEYGTSANHSMLVSADPALASQIDTQVTSTQELATQLDDKIASANATAKSWSTWRTAGTVITALLTIGSILLTAYDLYRYYNVNYTPIPKYIVDEADITCTDENGNQLVVRNDTAYYTAAPTNRPETHEQYKSLQDYADLNGDVGKEWLALYYAKQTGGEPILASSLKVVTGSTSLPEGYTRGIHMFGSRAAANLTDSRYSYKDDLNGIYLYYQTEAPTAAASVFSGGALALVGTGSAAAGAALGAAGAALFRRKKAAPAA